jgi:hypothetical protein
MGASASGSSGAVVGGTVTGGSVTTEEDGTVVDGVAVLCGMLSVVFWDVPGVTGGFSGFPKIKNTNSAASNAASIPMAINNAFRFMENSSLWGIFLYDIKNPNKSP